MNFHGDKIQQLSNPTVAFKVSACKNSVLKKLTFFTETKTHHIK